MGLHRQWWAGSQEVLFLCDIAFLEFIFSPYVCVNMSGREGDMYTYVPSKTRREQQILFSWSYRWY